MAMRSRAQSTVATGRAHAARQALGYYTAGDKDRLQNAWHEHYTVVVGEVDRLDVCRLCLGITVHPAYLHPNPGPSCPDLTLPASALDAHSPHMHALRALSHLPSIEHRGEPPVRYINP